MSRKKCSTFLCLRKKSFDIIKTKTQSFSFLEWTSTDFRRKLSMFRREKKKWKATKSIRTIFMLFFLAIFFYSNHEKYIPISSLCHHYLNYYFLFIPIIPSLSYHAHHTFIAEARTNKTDSDHSISLENFYSPCSLQRDELNLTKIFNPSIFVGYQL